MTRVPNPFEDVEGTREQILAATYRALCTHGYADLTIKRIGEAFEKSPSLVYHHYEDKDDVVLACLEYLLERYETRLTDDSIDHPREELSAFLDWVLEPEAEPERRQFVAVLTELRARSCHDPAYRDHFTRSDRFFERYLATVLEAGIDRGQFRPCDPDRVASTLVTTLAGAMLRRSTSDDDAWLAAVRSELEAWLETRVYRSSEG